MMPSLRASHLMLPLASVAVLLAGCASSGAEAGGAERFRALVFSKTEGYRHPSIADGRRAVRELGAANDFAVHATEEADVFTSDSLAQYDVVVFLNTTGDVFDEAQQRAFRSYVEAGGGFAGIHAAADTEHDWGWYGGLVGAYFESHPNDPNVRTATVHVTDRAHPSTRGLPEVWERTDEWYDYRRNPRGDVDVLATVDEATYGSDGTMGEDHPIAWKHVYAGGARAWYTGGGHTKANYADSLFRRHLLGGIEWSAGAAD